MLLLASHVPFRIVLPEELPKLSPKEIPLLILPDVVSITEDEAREFAAYMLRGGKLFATGYPGIYNDRGQWHGDVGEPFPMAGILGLYYPENTMPGEGAPQPAYKRRKSLLYTLERFGKKYFFGVGIDPNEGTAAQEPYPSGMAQNIEKRFAKELFAMYTPPVKVEAPSSLLADFGKMGNSYVIRLANFSGTKRFSQTVEPVKNVKIVVTSPEKIKEAYFIPYLSSEKMVLKPVTKNGKTAIILDELERGGIVVCTW